MSLLNVTSVRPNQPNQFPDPNTEAKTNLVSKPFHVHEELERWIKKQNITEDDVDPLSTAELVQIFTESRTDARYHLNESITGLLLATLCDRLICSDDGAVTPSFQIERPKGLNQERVNFSELKKLPLCDVVKALQAFSSYSYSDAAEKVIIALKDILLSHDENQTSNLSKLTIDELTSVCALFYNHRENKIYDVLEAITDELLANNGQKLLQNDPTVVKLVVLLLVKLRTKGEALVEKLATNWKTLQKLILVVSKFESKSEDFLTLFAKQMKPYGIVGFEFACENGLEKLCLELVKQGLNTKQTNQFKNTALHIAVLHQLKLVVQEILIRYPGEVNRINQLENSPLHISCTAYNIPIAELLLTHKADPNICNKLGFPPFWLPSIRLKRQNEQEKIPIVQFYSHFFQGFDHVITHLQQVNCHSLLPFLEANPESAKYKAENKEAPGINPFEIAFIMNHQPFSLKIINQLTDAKCKEYFNALIKKYPHARDTILCLLYVNACEKWQQENAISYAELMSVQTLNKTAAILSAFRYKLPQVIEMLCKKGVDVNCVDRKGETPLHETCKRGYADTAELLLQHKVDLTLKNKKGKTAFQCMLTSTTWQKNPQKMQPFLKRFFNDFPALMKRIEQHKGENFSEYFTNYPELLVEEPHVSKDANPLFIPLVFNDASVAKALFIKLGQDRYHKKVQLLKAKYPATDFDGLEFAGYEVNLQHLKQKVPEEIPDKPENATLNEMLAFFNDVNFQDSTKMPYFDPEAYGLHFTADKTFAEQLDEGFLKVVKEQKVTMPPPEIEARKQFYRDVENTLCLTTRTVKTPDQKAALLSRCTKLISVCAGGILPVCLNLYNEYVKGIPSTFEPALFEKLGDLRKMLLESLLPPGQDTHHFLMLFYPLSKKEELNLPYAKAAYDDRVAAANAVDIAATKAKFFQKYVPCLIVPYIERQIEQDGQLRGRYIDYWKKLLPETWSEVVYEDIEAAKLDRRLITKTLEELEVISPACRKGS